MIRTLKAKLNLKNVTLDLILLYLYKFFYQLLVADKQKRVILAIIGCQRSGTSLLTRVFARDIHAKVYRETSPLSSADPRTFDRKKLRLNPLPQVKLTLTRDRAELIVLKPLVESQNILAFFDFFPEAKALWMYRHYRDVVNSNLNAFGTDVVTRDLKPIIERQPGNWRAENIAEETRAIIVQHVTPSLSPQDAAALFWFVRNQLFFDLKLHTNPRVYLCRYDDFAAEPGQTMREVYAFLRRTYPGDQIIQEVHDESVMKGQSVELSPSVEQLCQELLHRLDAKYTLRSFLL